MAMMLVPPTPTPAAAGCSSAAVAGGLGFGSLDDYEIVEELGAGSFGIVYLAGHRATRNLVAIKQSIDVDGDAALLHEAALLQRCAGVAAVIGVNEIAICPKTKRPFMVMDFVRRSLTGVMNKRGPFSEVEARGIMMQLLDAAEMMRRLNVIHRDLKPDNILIKRHNEICRIANKLGVPDEVSGIKCFSEPSQLRQMVPVERLSEEGFQVLQGLLEFEASKRLTAVAALEMPWFR